jgi:hypothetical protein
MRAISCLWRDAFLLGAQHDRCAVGVVGADVPAFVAAHLLEAHPDVGLDVLDQVAEVDRAVGIGQGAGNEDLAGHDAVFPGCRRRACGLPQLKGALYRGGVAAGFRRRESSGGRHSRAGWNPCLLPRAGSRPGRRPTFLLVQASRQRSTPRLPGLTASDSPRCGRPAGPVAKLAGQKRPSSDNATGLPPANLPRSAGQRGMKSVARGAARLQKCQIRRLIHFR